VRRARSKAAAVTEDRHALASLFAPHQGAFRRTASRQKLIDLGKENGHHGDFIAIRS